jgi:hypothetical protein
LALNRDLRNPLGQALAPNERGALHLSNGNLVQAEQCHQQAHELARAIGNARAEAHALAGLGRCANCRRPGRASYALLRQAHELFHRIGATEAPSVVAELSALTIPGLAQ